MIENALQSLIWGLQKHLSKQTYLQTQNLNNRDGMCVYVCMNEKGEKRRGREKRQE